MEQKNRKKRNIIVAICIAAGICLIGGAVTAVLLQQRNPLETGLTGLSEEITALQEELGEHFWMDAVNQIGNENIQAEYSVNIGGIEELKNITIGLDGTLKRDIEQKLFETKSALSVANLEIAKISLSGAAETLYLQIPAVWEGSVIFNTNDIDRQWNNSTVKNGLALLTGEELEINRRINVNLFEKYYVNSNWLNEFLEENEGNLKALYENMEVMKVRRAQKKGLLSAEQAEKLENHVLEDAEGKQIMTTCYLVILPKEWVKEIFRDLEVDIKLCIYLDGNKRIVRICTLPGETLETEFWSGMAALDLTGTEAVTDRIELEAEGKLKDGEIAGSILIEKNREDEGFYQVECDASLTEQENEWEISFAGSVHGQRLDRGEKVSIEADRLVVKSQGKTVCRGSGAAEFAPLTETVRMPTGKEYRIAEMGEFDGVLFLAECMEKVSKNYSGYLKFLS